MLILITSALQMRMDKDEKRTPPSSKNFVFLSHLLFKRRNILQMLFENSNKVRRGF